MKACSYAPILPGEADSCIHTHCITVTMCRPTCSICAVVGLKPAGSSKLILPYLKILLSQLLLLLAAPLPAATTASIYMVIGARRQMST